nr:hypothetical protein BgiMline_023121 [Biomphalaria glabrata]
MSSVSNMWLHLEDHPCLQFQIGGYIWRITHVFSFKYVATSGGSPMSSVSNRWLHLEDHPCLQFQIGGYIWRITHVFSFK